MQRTAVKQKISASFPSDFITELRARSSIEEIIGDYVVLKKQGKGLSGCCPFHTESTPSFHVSPTKKLFHCFGCGKGGDVFSFVQEKEGLNFVEAVKQLADRFGLDIPESAYNEEYEKIVSIQDVLVKINKKALEYFLTQLANTDEIKEYLKERGISEATTKTFSLGYTPKEWNSLKVELKTEFEDSDIRISGLMKENDDELHPNYFSLFHNRLMVPIFDVRGRVIAFGGRALDDIKPKYLNSPETPLYVKGNHLYGLYQTRDDIKKKGFAILTEGYFDLIALYEHGVTNVVASLGTSLTENQAKLLRRYTDKIVICYDGDNAGLSAAERATEVLLKEGFTIKVMVLPDKKDPDDYIREFGKKTFGERRNQSDNWFKFRVQRIKSKTDMSNPTDKAKAVEEIIEVVSKCPTDIERHEFFNEAMRLMKVDSRIAKKLSANLRVNNKTVAASEMVVRPNLAETRFLELIVCNNDTRAEYIQKLKGVDAHLSIDTILDSLETNGELNYTELEEQLSESSMILLREALVKSDEIDCLENGELEEELDSCIGAIAVLTKEAQLEDNARKIKSEQNESVLFELMDEQSKLLNDLELLRN